MSYEDKHFQVSKNIRWQIEQGEKNFVIYPFGVNGVMVADILKTQFGIQPSYIIDNTLHKFNKNFHSVDFLDSLKPSDYMVLLTIENPETIESVRHAIYSHYPKNRVLELFPWHTSSDVRISWLRRYAEFVYEKSLQGSVAECGVNQGDFAQYLNMFFPDRTCYLFDSFEGFREEDIISDNKHNSIEATPHRSYFFQNIGGYKATTVDIVMSKMSHPEKVVIKQGYVPETLIDVEDSFCFVNLDMDVYMPMLEGMRFFYPRMVNDGIILLHDYYSGGTLTGVEAAVYEYEREIGETLCKIPSESSSSLVVVKR